MTLPAGGPYVGASANGATLSQSSPLGAYVLDGLALMERPHSGRGLSPGTVRYALAQARRGHILDCRGEPLNAQRRLTSERARIICFWNASPVVAQLTGMRILRRGLQRPFWNVNTRKQINKSDCSLVFADGIKVEFDDPIFLVLIAGHED